MPIYAYRCQTCGHEKDVIQKFSDTPLSICPSCGADAFRKQLTAPSFQLKGSGWYVTDFRDSGKAKGGSPDAGKPGADGGQDNAKDGTGTPAPAVADGAAATTAPASGDATKPAAKPAADAPAPAAKPSPST
jgi:putative FmdB family regulatory protein